MRDSRSYKIAWRPVSVRSYAGVMSQRYLFAAKYRLHSYPQIFFLDSCLSFFFLPRSRCCLPITWCRSVTHSLRAACTADWKVLEIKMSRTVLKQWTWLNILSETAWMDEWIVSETGTIPRQCKKVKDLIGVLSDKSQKTGSAWTFFSL